jgi:hypothetical protein
VLEGLLEVPADRLVVRRRVAARSRREPLREAGVELGPRVAQRAPVGGVADQHVVEALGRLAQEPAAVGIRLDQLAAAERLEARIEVGKRLGRQQMRQRRARELPPDHRRALEHEALLGAQALDAGREQRLDRGRHVERGELHGRDPAIAFATQHAVVHEHAYQLAEEERVALARGEHAARDRRGERIRADQARGESRRGARVESAEGQGVRHGAARRRERGAHLAQLRARGGEDEQRHARSPLHEVLDQIQQQRLGPVQVVDREHHGPLRGERAEEPPHREECLLGRRRRAGVDRRYAGADALPLRLVRDRRGVERRPQRLRERREGGAAGGVARGDEHGRTLAEPARELAHEARLPEARGAEHHRELRPARRDRRLVHRAEAAELGVAPHEGGGRGPRRPFERDDAVGGHRLGAPLEREAADGRERHPVGDEAPRGLADQHVARADGDASVASPSARPTVASALRLAPSRS